MISRPLAPGLLDGFGAVGLGSIAQEGEQGPHVGNLMMGKGSMKKKVAPCFPDTRKLPLIISPPEWLDKVVTWANTMITPASCESGLFSSTEVQGESSSSRKHIVFPRSTKVVFPSFRGNMKIITPLLNAIFADQDPTPVAAKEAGKRQKCPSQRSFNTNSPAFEVKMELHLNVVDWPLTRYEVVPFAKVAKPHPQCQRCSV